MLPSEFEATCLKNRKRRNRRKLAWAGPAACWLPASGRFPKPRLLGTISCSQCAGAKRGHGYACHVSDPLPWGRALGPLGRCNRPVLSRDPLVQTRDYGRVHQRPVRISRRLRGLVRGRQELRGAGEHLYSEAHFPAKARSGLGTAGEVGREWGPGASVSPRRRGEGRSWVGFGIPMWRFFQSRALPRDWPVFPGALDWLMGVVDLSEALGGAHRGPKKQRLETSNLLAVLCYRVLTCAVHL